MSTRRLVLGLCCLGLPAVVDVLRVICVAVAVLHAQGKLEPMTQTPAEMTSEMPGGFGGTGPSGRVFVDPPD